MFSQTLVPHSQGLANGKGASAPFPPRNIGVGLHRDKRKAWLLPQIHLSSFHLKISLFRGIRKWQSWISWTPSFALPLVLPSPAEHCPAVPSSCRYHNQVHVHHSVHPNSREHISATLAKSSQTGTCIPIPTTPTSSEEQRARQMLQLGDPWPHGSTVAFSALSPSPPSK